MSWVCEEYKKAIEEFVETPVEERLKKTKEKCKKKKCKKLCLCCNKWKCWVEIFFETIIRWIITIVIKWLFYVVCRIVSWLVDAIAGLVGLIGWIVERIVGLPELILCGFGTAGARKHLHLSVFVWTDGKRTPLVPISVVQEHVRVAKEVYLRECNVEIHAPEEPVLISAPPEGAESHACNAGGWFSSKKSLYNSFALPGTVAAIFIRDIPGNSVGCHIPGTQYVLVDAGVTLNTTLAHEIGHACDLLRHRNSTPKNLMCSASVPRTGSELTKWQRCVVRTSNNVGWLS